MTDPVKQLAESDIPAAVAKVESAVDRLGDEAKAAAVKAESAAKAATGTAESGFLSAVTKVEAFYVAHKWLLIGLSVAAVAIALAVR